LPTLPNDTVVIVNLSGRGDKDVETIRGILAERDAVEQGGAA